MKFTLLALTAILVAGCSTATDRTVSSENTEATVMITNVAKNSGGSGVVLSSDATSSTVLTNAHVCGVAKFGGIVTTTGGISGFVSSYKVSATHDLCLITVSADLQASASLAFAAPKKYDRATISGHPRLLPNILTFGHFSEKRIVQVVMGSRACTEEEFENPNTGLFCRFTGHLPIVRTFEAIVVSATIQPGSSGSGIFDADHRLAALVFAGSGDLGYAMAVPYEYIDFFLNRELALLPVQIPNNDMIVGLTSESNNKAFTEACKAATNEFHKNMCQAIGNTTLF